MTALAQLGDVRSLSPKAVAFYGRSLLRGAAFARATDDQGNYAIAYWNEQAGAGQNYSLRENETPPGALVLAMQQSAIQLARAGDADAAGFIMANAPLYLVQPSQAKWVELRAKYVQLIDSVRFPNPSGFDATTLISIAAGLALLGGGYYLYKKAT